MSETSLPEHKGNDEKGRIPRSKEDDSRERGLYL
jgi:hypothetical protein